MNSCVPSPFSKEAGLILLQGCLLVSRTLLTDYISRVEGYCGRSIVSLVGRVSHSPYKSSRDQNRKGCAAVHWLMTAA